VISKPQPIHGAHKPPAENVSLGYQEVDSLPKTVLSGQTNHASSGDIAVNNKIGEESVVANMPKVPRGPRRARSAIHFFMKENSQTVKEQHPSVSTKELVSQT